MNDFSEEYKRKKRNHAQREQPQTQKQRLKQELRKLPEGKELNNWICQHIANRIGEPVVWQYANQGQGNQVELYNGKTNNRLLVTEINRQEIAQTRAMGQSWIDQLMMAIDGSEGKSPSQMHEKFEKDLSNRYEEMMEKITDQ